MRAGLILVVLRMCATTGWMRTSIGASLNPPLFAFAMGVRTALYILVIGVIIDEAWSGESTYLTITTSSGDFLKAATNICYLNSFLFYLFSLSYLQLVWPQGMELWMWL
jgi:hypothetical protein